MHTELHAALPNWAELGGAIQTKMADRLMGSDLRIIPQCVQWGLALIGKATELSYDSNHTSLHARGGF